MQTNNKEDIYKVSEPLIGTGWQDRFKDQDRVLVWTGPGTNSTLSLRVSKVQKYSITVGIIGAQDSKQIEQAKIYIDDIEYPTNMLTSSTYPNYLLRIEAVLQKEFELRVNIPFCVNPSEVLGATDYRNLGIVIGQISIEPYKLCFKEKNITDFHKK